MPRKRVEELTLKERRAWFLSLYVKNGCSPTSIPALEKRAGLNAGSAQKLLKRKAVKEIIHKAMTPVREAQAAIVQRSAQASGIATQKERKMVRHVGRLTKANSRLEWQIQYLLSLPRLEELNEKDAIATINLCMLQNLDLPLKLDSAKLFLIVNRWLEDGRFRRSPVSDQSQGGPGTGMYQSLFKRLALNPGPAVSTLDEPLAPPPDASPIYPNLEIKPKTESTPASTTLPPEGEAIDEKPEEYTGPRRRRTIEL